MPKSPEQQEREAVSKQQLAEQKVAFAAVVEAIAPVCHDANRAYRASIGEDPGPSWADAPEDLRASSRAGVQHRIQNPEAPLELSHDLWMTRKVAEGWLYGAEKDPAQKTHPQLLPWDALPDEQKRKDALFAAICSALTADLTRA